MTVKSKMWYCVGVLRRTLISWQKVIEPFIVSLVEADVRNELSEWGLPANSRFWWPVFGRGTIPGWWNTRAHHLEHYDVLREQWLHSSPSPWTLISKRVSWFTQGLSETAVPQPDHISAGLLITPSGLIHAPWKVSSAQNDRHAAPFNCPRTKVPSLKSNQRLRLTPPKEMLHVISPSLLSCWFGKTSEWRNASSCEEVKWSWII